MSGSLHGEDVLIYGIGAQTNDFKTPGVQEHAFFFKELTDARKAASCGLSQSHQGEKQGPCAAFALELHMNTQRVNASLIRFG